MGALTEVLGAPRTQSVTLKNGITVTIRELPLSVTWPFMQGEPVEPEVLIRAAVIDDQGKPAIAADEEIPMAQAVELLPHIMKLSQLEVDGAPEVADLQRDFPRPASAG